MPYNNEMTELLLESLDVSQLVPASLAPWRPLLLDGMAFFLTRLPGDRQAAIVADQFALPEDTDAATRLVTLLVQCPTLHKLGQVLARNRQLPVEIRRQLQTLESMLPTTPMAQILSRIREELPDDLPVTLAPHALAEGSVAVVLPFTYQEDGKTCDGVFKLLKPGIEERFTEEIAIWAELGTFLEERGRSLGLPALEYRHTLDSVRELLAHEIDLQVEQSNLRAAHAFHAHDPRILIPQVLPWCTAKVTAMERIFGNKVTDGDLSANHRADLASAMVSALIGQPFWSAAEVAMLHADLHAGNLIAANDGRLAILDWSLTLHLSKADREMLVSIIAGGLTLDAGRIRNAVAALGSMREDDPILSRTVERALDRVVFERRFPGFEWLMEWLDELALNTATGFRHDFVLFRKTWLSLSGVIADLVETHSSDAQLLGLGLERFIAELPARVSALPEPAHLSTHVSNTNVLRLCASAWLVPARYWARVWRRHGMLPAVEGNPANA